MFAQEWIGLWRKKSANLQNAEFIREVYYPDWLTNVVMVNKANGKWRMCIDFMDLNKVCPKDSYPLSWIDVLVDSTAGYELLSFMDTFFVTNRLSWMRLIRRTLHLSPAKAFSATKRCHSVLRMRAQCIRG